MHCREKESEEGSARGRIDAEGRLFCVADFLVESCHLTK